MTGNWSQINVDFEALYPAAAMLGFLGVVCLLGNGTIVALHILKPQVRNDQHLVPGLAVIDFFTGIYSLMCAGIPFIPPFRISQRLCAWVFQLPVFHCVATVPAYTFTLSLMRSIAFRNPILFQRLNKEKVVVGLHVLINIYGTAFTSTVIAWSRTDVYVPICQPGFSAPQLLIKILASACTALAVCIVLVNVQLRKAVKTRLQQTTLPIATRRRDQQLASSLVIVSWVFVSTLTVSTTIFVLVDSFGTHWHKIVYGYYCTILMATNSSCNLFIYIWRSQVYQTALGLNFATMTTSVSTIETRF